MFYPVSETAQKIWTSINREKKPYEQAITWLLGTYHLLPRGLNLGELFFVASKTIQSPWVKGQKLMTNSPSLGGS